MFITLEGPEGSGKTSQIKELREFLNQQGYVVWQTREPGGSPIGDQVRTILTSMENKSMHPRTEILLFCAARAQHVEEVIRPRLQRGEIVLCDRYSDSTLAYQGYGHGCERVFLRQLLDYATDGLRPHLTLLLDVDVEVGLHRRRSSGGEWNRLDALALSFHQRVRQGYLELAREEPQRWKIIDAAQPPEQVQSALRKAILEHLHPG